ncbi:MAG: TonB-dependent receptor [Thermoanaerobaculia bacterium]
MNRIRSLPRTHFFTLCLILLLTTATAVAQTTTATIKGTIVDANGDPVAGAEVNAVNQATGNVYQAISGDDGSYILAGIRPGTYDVIVASPAFEPKARTLQLLVGQSINANFNMSPAVVLSEEITVVGTQVVEMETHQIATQVTPMQIETLPQDSRNFMNFAALAPGVTISDNPTRKTFQAGAQSADAVNVFVDGVSYKNDILQGGIVGQDASRGNPFPQNAVQEFRVLTQNYTAEFQKASSAVITAVTKSGTNTLSGEVFSYFQDNDLVDEDPLTGANPFFERLQSGVSLGGPIIRDRLHYFLSYEGNDQEREEQVRFGGEAVNAPQELIDRLSPFLGLHPSEFDSDLFFGKGTFQPGRSQIVDFSVFVRSEEDVRSFGGTNSVENAENVLNDVENYSLRHQYTSTAWFNEASLNFQEYVWNPTPLRQDIVGQNFAGILKIGGRSTEQDKSQERFSIRDDLTFSPLDWYGSHVIKVGANFDDTSYDLKNFLVGVPQFTFRKQENWAFPHRVEFGFGDPFTGADNTVWGFYVQDEWAATDRLLVNVGVRYDYESDMFPTDWVTPANIRNDLGFLVDDAKYFTDGDDRQAIDDMWAPRLGLTYDMFGNNRTVVFGGWGRYWDRTLRGETDSEKFRQTWNRGELLFSLDGQPLPDGRLTVQWDPSLLDMQNLFEFVQQANVFRPEVFLIENDTEAPYADQWTFGVRQRFGDLVGSLSYAGTRSYNGFTYGWGHRNPDGTCCRWGEVQGLGYQALITSQDDKRTWYDAIFLKLDKPFTADSRWGGGLSYTGSLTAEAIGGDLFSFDFPTVLDYPRRPLNNIQDHRVVANALFRLPWNLTAGSVVNYGSGLRFDVIDQSAGTGPLQRILRGEGEGSPYLTVDLRLQYDIEIAGIALGLVGEAFNVTNDEIEDQWERVLGRPNFGKATSIVPNSQRRFQYGVRLRY